MSDAPEVWSVWEDGTVRDQDGSELDEYEIVAGHDALRGQVAELRAENERLRARVAELEADGRRLDWLDRADTDDIGFGEYGHKWRVADVHCDDLRACIDAAMAEEQP